MSENNVYEINLLTVARKLWKKRLFIVLIMVIFIGIGIFLFFYKQASPVYTAESSLFVQQREQYLKCEFPENNDGEINYQKYITNVIEPLPVEMYPKMMRSVSFLRKLMVKKVDVNGDKVALIDFCTHGKYSQPVFRDKLLKYTLQLPGTIMGKQEYTPYQMPDNNQDPVINLSGVEYACISMLKSNIIVTNAPKDILNISVTMPNPVVAAQVVYEIQQLLQQNLLDIRKKELTETVQIIQNQLDSINKRIVEHKSHTSLVESEVGYLLTDLQAELTEQLIKIPILWEATSPSLFVIEPVTVPLHTSNAHSGLFTYVILFAFLGLLLGFCLVFFIPFALCVSNGGWITRWISKKWN